MSVRARLLLALVALAAAAIAWFVVLEAIRRTV
jgi:cytochrome c-type biogenesis protein CcmE